VDHVWPWMVAPSSPELGLWPLWCPRAPAKGQERGSGTWGTDGPLTGAWEAVRQPGDGGEGGGGRNFGTEHARAQRVGNGGRG
jgi:hypothetical protein